MIYIIQQVSSDNESDIKLLQNFQRVCESVGLDSSIVSLKFALQQQLSGNELVVFDSDVKDSKELTNLFAVFSLLPTGSLTLVDTKYGFSLCTLKQRISDRIVNRLYTDGLRIRRIVTNAEHEFPEFLSCEIFTYSMKLDAIPETYDYEHLQEQIRNMFT